MLFIETDDGALVLKVYHIYIFFNIIIFKDYKCKIFKLFYIYIIFKLNKTILEVIINILFYIREQLILLLSGI